jgi:hypothetical protein
MTQWHKKDERGYPPGFEPPTDIRAPWYRWLIWSFGVVAAILVIVVVGEWLLRRFLGR